MADAILHEGELWLVDFSARMSSSGTKMLYHTCDDLSYPTNVINAALGEEWRMINPKPAIPTYYSFLPFPKGKISNIQYPDASQLDEIVLSVEEGGRVFEMRNDVQVADRGLVVATSPDGTRNDAEDTVLSFINNIQYDVD